MLKQLCLGRYKCILLSEFHKILELEVINRTALQICTFFCENTMAPSVSEAILRAEHESGFKNLPSSQVNLINFYNPCPQILIF